MKYLEELIPGNSFRENDELYLLSTDFKFKDNKKYFFCLNMKTGFPKWISASTVVNNEPLFFIDNEQNVVAII